MIVGHPDASALVLVEELHHARNQHSQNSGSEEGEPEGLLGFLCLIRLVDAEDLLEEGEDAFLGRATSRGLRILRVFRLWIFRLRVILKVLNKYPTDVSVAKLKLT